MRDAWANRNDLEMLSHSLSIQYKACTPLCCGIFCFLSLRERRQQNRKKKEHTNCHVLADLACSTGKTRLTRTGEIVEEVRASSSIDTWVDEAVINVRLREKYR